MRIVSVPMSLFALHGMFCLFGMSLTAMAVVLAQFSCGLQLGWAAGRMTVLALTPTKLPGYMDSHWGK